MELFRYANECTVDGKLYQQGVGKTKKEAKTNAAIIALDALLGLKDSPYKVIAPSKLDALYGDEACSEASSVDFQKSKQIDVCMLILFMLTKFCYTLFWLYRHSWQSLGYYAQKFYFLFSRN